MRKSLVLACCVAAAGIAGAQGSDSCTTPQAIAGLGPHAFDNNGATTADTGLCTVVNSNVWFAWTAPATGAWQVRTCGQTTLDTKIAVYDGLACPPTTSLGCNDDACSLQTAVTFNAVGGQQYMIEVGSWSSTTQGAGTFDFASVLDCTTGSDDHLEDNDTCGTALAMGDGTETGLITYWETVDDDWYTGSVADGATVTVNIFFTDALGDVDLELTDGCGGAVLDGSYSTSDNEDVSWTNTTGGPVQVIWQVYVWGTSNPPCNEYDMTVTGITPSGPGTNYCSSVPNSTGSPAVMSGSGSGSVTGTDLSLSAASVPDQPYIFFHAANQISVPFGNGGLLCAGGDIIRSAPQIAAGQTATITYDNDVAFPPYSGVTRNFQCWFRDPAAGGDAYNTSDGYSVDITP